MVGENGMLDVFTRIPATVKEASVRKGLFYPLEIAVFLALFFVAQAVIPSAEDRFMKLMLAAKPGAPAMLMIESYSCAFAIMVYVCYARLVQKRPLSGLGFATTRVNAAIEYARGLAIGFLMFTAAILVETMHGYVSILGTGGTAAIPYVTIAFAGTLIQGMAEEVAFRGYFMVSIARRYPVWLAIFTNSLLFGLVHLTNTGATAISTVNTCLIAIFFSIVFLKRDSIWMCGAIHSAWNFAQSCVFGQHTSGFETVPSIFVMSNPTGASMFTGGVYGVEASLIATIIEVIAIIGALRMKQAAAEENQE